MTKTYKESNKNGIRLYISNDDLRKWNLETVADDSVVNWIRLGIDKEKSSGELTQFIEIVDRLEKKISNLSLFCSKYLHQIVMSTINLEQDLFEDAQNPSENEKLDLMRKRMHESLKMQKKYFYELDEFNFATFFEGQKEYFDIKINDSGRQ